MIEILPESRGNILGVEARGKLTERDYQDVWIPRLKEMVQEYGQIRCLVHFSEDFEGWDLDAMWDDAKFGFEHARDFEKIAVVGGPKWIEWGSRVAGLLVNGMVRTFPEDELNHAWQWISS